jgi:predicted transcriptional regulator
MPTLSKQIMLRVSEETDEVLGLVARTQGRSKQDVVREAVEDYVRAQMHAGMRERIRSRHAAERALYDRLAR